MIVVHPNQNELRFIESPSILKLFWFLMKCYTNTFLVFLTFIFKHPPYFKESRNIAGVKDY